MEKQGKVIEKNQGDQLQIRRVERSSGEYPDRLRDLNRMPKELYVIGSLPRDDRPSAAIVGARLCSPYGRAQAYRYARELAAAGVQIISGMARGVDGCAHRGALEGGGDTWAVLGCGVDICYPRENRDLYQDIPRRGGLISEYPPGRPPLGSQFPARNRIISALADLVLVVEARERSGSLITVDFALEQGKTVYAVPGRAGDPLSAGCNRLIAQGAGIALSPRELLEEWGITPDKNTLGEEKNNFGLARTGDMVYSCLSLVPKHLSCIAREAGVAPAEAGTRLLELVLQGLAQETARNYFVRK